MTISIQAIIILSVVLLVSLVVNAVMIWYARASIVQLSFVSENISDLKDSVQNYAKHLKSVYELDMFYGDETLAALMKHTGELQDSLDDYDDFYDLFGAAPLEVTQVMVEETQEEEDAETP
tara:strand:- start:509 stop:871 length:363 start_codon:yes stop_codon:yes gene_type:complete